MKLLWEECSVLMGPNSPARYIQEDSWEASLGLCKAVCSSYDQPASSRGALIARKILDHRGMGPGGSSRAPRSQTSSIILSPWEAEPEEAPPVLGQPGLHKLVSKTKSKHRYFGELLILCVQAGGVACSSCPVQVWGDVNRWGWDTASSHLRCSTCDCSAPPRRECDVQRRGCSRI